MIRSTWLGLTMALGLTSFSGCDSGTATFVPKSGYTSESLAQELAFRYGRMDPISRPKPIASRRNREPEGTAEKVQAKSGAKTKEGRAVTLEDLVDDVVTKSWQMPDANPEEVLRKVAEIVGKDEKIKEADRRLMAERLVKSK